MQKRATLTSKGPSPARLLRPLKSSGPGLRRVPGQMCTVVPTRLRCDWLQRFPRLGREAGKSERAYNRAARILAASGPRVRRGCRLINDPLLTVPPQDRV